MVAGPSKTWSSTPAPEDRSYAEGTGFRIRRQYDTLDPGHAARFLPRASRYQLLQPPEFHTDPASLAWTRSLNRCWVLRRTSIRLLPVRCMSLRDSRM